MTYPSLDPDIFRIGPFAVRWYGLMYLLGFAASYTLVRYQIKKRHIALSREFLDSFYTVLILGLIIGARVGYVIFYNASYYIEHPFESLAVWRGGLSFHGGLIGTTLAGIWHCRRNNVDAWQVADLVTVTAPIGLGLGRLGNFINAELYGRTTTMPWGMVFPGGGPLPRHPSQLYELFLEGVLLFVILWWLKNKFRNTGALFAIFIALYGMFRFIVEFFREPDAHLGFIAGPFTMGQILSASMVLAGGLIYHFRNRR